MIFRIAGYLLFLAVLAWRQAPPLYQKGLKKELVLYALLLGCAAALGSLMIAEVELTSPSQVLQEVFEPLHDRMFDPNDSPGKR